MSKVLGNLNEKTELVDNVFSYVISLKDLKNVDEEGNIYDKRINALINKTMSALLSDLKNGNVGDNNIPNRYSETIDDKKVNMNIDFKDGVAFVNHMNSFINDDEINDNTSEDPTEMVDPLKDWSTSDNTPKKGITFEYDHFDNGYIIVPKSINNGTKVKELIKKDTFSVVNFVDGRLGDEIIKITLSKLTNTDIYKVVIEPKLYGVNMTDDEYGVIKLVEINHSDLFPFQVDTDAYMYIMLNLIINNIKNSENIVEDKIKFKSMIDIISELDCVDSVSISNDDSRNRVMFNNKSIYYSGQYALEGSIKYIPIKDAITQTSAEFSVNISDSELDILSNFLSGKHGLTVVLKTMNIEDLPNETTNVVVLQGTPYLIRNNPVYTYSPIVLTNTINNRNVIYTHNLEDISKYLHRIGIVFNINTEVLNTLYNSNKKYNTITYNVQQNLQHINYQQPMFNGDYVRPNISMPSDAQREYFNGRLTTAMKNMHDSKNLKNITFQSDDIICESDMLDSKGEHKLSLFYSDVNKYYIKYSLNNNTIFIPKDKVTIVGNMLLTINKSNEQSVLNDILKKITE